MPTSAVLMFCVSEVPQFLFQQLLHIGPWPPYTKTFIGVSKLTKKGILLFMSLCGKQQCSDLGRFVAH